MGFSFLFLLLELFVGGGVRLLEEKKRVESVRARVCDQPPTAIQSF